MPGDRRWSAARPPGRHCRSAITGPPKPGTATRYGCTDCIVACTAAMLVGDALELVVEVVSSRSTGWTLAWIAEASAVWSDWIWVTWLWVRPVLVSTAAVSVWTVVTACDPVSVPFWIASRSSWTWPTDACVGCELADRSLLRSDCSVWNADCTAAFGPVVVACLAVEVAVPVARRGRCCRPSTSSSSREPRGRRRAVVVVVVVPVPEVVADWIADWTAWRSDWIWLTCVELRPMLVRMAASSFWIAVVAARARERPLADGREVILELADRGVRRLRPDRHIIAEVGLERLERRLDAPRTTARSATAGSSSRRPCSGARPSAGRAGPSSPPPSPRLPAPNIAPRTAPPERAQLGHRRARVRARPPCRRAHPSPSPATGAACRSSASQPTVALDERRRAAAGSRQTFSRSDPTFYHPP